MTVAEVWAPHAEVVDLVHEPVDGGTLVRITLDRDDDGWHRGGELAPGDRYRFSLDGEEPLPDPRSGWQPDGIDGPSAVDDPSSYGWTDATWRGFHLAGSGLYELHVGTFSPEGTFDGAVAHLDHLVELGVDAVEVMPVAEFMGERGWGYDGVLLRAPHHAYGGPGGFRRFVDACHARGLGVLLDVVFNHLGPKGNHLARFGPYFTDHHHTPWGQAVNLDGPGAVEVRRFVIEGATRWLRDFHVDGLRLDACHALVDDSAVHILEELAVEVGALAAHVGRPLWLIAESDRHDPRTVRPVEAGGLGLHAQWADDLHHAMHALLVGERDGYYADFGSVATLAQALTEVYVDAGRYSPMRGRVHGRSVSGIGGDRFVVCTQNHDQIGNRARGERLAHLVDEGAARVAAALVLTSPCTPLLFQGEEWAASTPFPYVVDVPDDPELATAIRDGRRNEFAAFGWAPEDVPDPLDPATFASAALRWKELARGEHAPMLDWYRSLLALRRARPDLTDPRRDEAHLSVAFHEAGRWLVVRRAATTVAVNLAEGGRTVPVGDRTEVLLASAGDVSVTAGEVALPPLSVAILA
ncbi:MAG: malto-oligosyltrehalose trehalohydrolase [Acidimicrobiia bacterium]|nr:malto-oligosyltrehalose trehalohydrolase [Acidimicrobiia bacterium]